VIAVDTNLLVYAHRAAVPEHRKAQRAIEEAAARPGGCAIPLPCVCEFWMVVTHPSSAGKPSRLEQARAFITNLLAGGLSIIYPQAGTAERLVKLAADLNVTGPRIFDLQIGLICRQAGVRELWTHDADFVSVPGLAVKDPL